MDGAGPWDYGLAFLVDADAYRPRLGAMHRVIPHLAPEEAARRAAEAFTVEKLLAGVLPGEVPAAGDGLASARTGRDGVPARRPVWMPAADRARLGTAGGRDAAEASPRWQALDASVMQELLLARLWPIKDNERDVLISHNAGEAIQMALDAGGTAVMCNPMPFGAVKEVAAHGERVPRKSTSFGPKPRTGLVLRTWEP